MNVTRFPEEGLSADYGDIILSAVTADVEMKVYLPSDTVNPVMQELYSPDAARMVYIRDLGKLAMYYQTETAVALSNGLDGSPVVFSVVLTENRSTPQTVSKTVTFYRCDAETNDSLTVEYLKRIPLSRGVSKHTFVGATEYLSFYTQGMVKARALYKGSSIDIERTVTVGSISVGNNNHYRFNVSPSYIASLLSIDPYRLISYAVYKGGEEPFTFHVDIRGKLNQTTFIFRNIFGAQEAMTCTGDVTGEKKWTRETGVLNRHRRQISRELENTQTVSTGYLTADETEILEDLLNSNEVYVIKNVSLERIIIQDETFKVTSRKDELISAEFKYRIASTNELQFYLNKNRIGLYLMTNLSRLIVTNTDKRIIVPR